MLMEGEFLKFYKFLKEVWKWPVELFKFIMFHELQDVWVSAFQGYYGIKRSIFRLNAPFNIFLNFIHWSHEGTLSE